MFTPRLRPRAAALPVARRHDGAGPMLLVLFALVFVPVAALHAAFLLAPHAADAHAPHRGH